MTASPLAERPGLLLRDPFRFSDSVIVVPPALARCLGCFDGAHTIVDLRDWLFRISGSPESEAAAESFATGLSQAGFLDDDVFVTLRTESVERFALAPIRAAAFAGGGYPTDQSLLLQTTEDWIGRAPPPRHLAGDNQKASDEILAIAAPHVSPSGGFSTYGAAYRTLGAEHADRTFVILGTSHYGEPNKLGLTRKNFQTPLGLAVTPAGLVDELASAAPDAFEIEDYCHAVEHSIEFQVVFLQSIFGPSVKILPILCGAFVAGTSTAGGADRHRPENVASVASALDALARLEDKHAGELLWVLAVDMAHMGRRYGDAIDARAYTDAMEQVAARDRERLQLIVNADADGFWRLSHEKGDDDLKWCGSAPFYAFLRTHPGVRGEVRAYEQWNIDDSSVVSFAALSFKRPP